MPSNVRTICHEATPPGLILCKMKTKSVGKQIFKDCIPERRASHHPQIPGGLLPLQELLNSCVMSIQSALFFILSGIPNPQPASSSSTVDFITMVTTKKRMKKKKEMLEKKNILLMFTCHVFGKQSADKKKNPLKLFHNFFFLSHTGQFFFFFLVKGVLRVRHRV